MHQPNCSPRGLLLKKVNYPKWRRRTKRSGFHLDCGHGKHHSRLCDLRISSSFLPSAGAMRTRGHACREFSTRPRIFHSPDMHAHPQSRRVMNNLCPSHASTGGPKWQLGPVRRAELRPWVQPKWWKSGVLELFYL